MNQKELYFLLENNKVGGVDTFIHSLSKFYRVHLIINSSHVLRANYKTNENIVEIIKFNTIYDLIERVPIRFQKVLKIAYIIIDRLTDCFFTMVHAKIQFKKIQLPFDSTLMIVQGGWPASIYGRVAIVYYGGVVSNVLLNIHNLSTANVKRFMGISQKLNEKALDAAKKVIFCSKSARNSFSVNQREKQIVIYNGVELGLSKERIPHNLNKPLSIGMIGTFESRKGFDEGIRAYGALIKSKLKLGDLHIYGTGTKKEVIKIKKIVQSCGLNKQVKFHGHILDIDMMYNNLDIVIVPSRSFESFGLVQIEALVRGIPVIVSDHGGLYEIASLIGNENIFESGRVNSLVEKLNYVISNYHEEVEKTYSMTKKIEYYLSVKKMADSYESEFFKK